MAVNILNMAMAVYRTSNGVARDLGSIVALNLGAVLASLIQKVVVLFLGRLLHGLRAFNRRHFHVVGLQRCRIVRATDATGDLLVNRFGQQFLAEGAEQIWLHEDVEPDLTQEFALHPIQFAVAQNREELR